MGAEDLVRSMRARMPWDVARRVLKANGLPRAQGWHKTVSRVVDGDAAYSAKDEALHTALEEHLLCGEKLVRLYRIETDAQRTLQETLIQLPIPDSSFKTLYPVTLDDDDLRAVHPAGLTLVSCERFETGVAAVLASTRFLFTRETFRPSELSEEVAAELNEFAELIGIRHRRIEALDVLWVPDEGFVELRIDYPRGMHQRHGSVAFENAEQGFTTLLGQNYLGNVVNLFPALERLYRARGDGSMVELAFMTSGAAQKNEKMRRDGSCFREEAYHLGGIGNLDEPIQLYKASVQWPVLIGENVQTFPEVSLIGTSLDTASADPQLQEMVIRDCSGFIDYDFVRDRIVEHLNAVADVVGP